MARQLHHAGEEAAPVVLLDTAAGIDEPQEAADDAQILSEILDGALPIATDELRRQGGLDAQLDYIVACARHLGLLPAGLDLARERRLIEVYRAAQQAALRYTPLPFPGKVVLLRAQEALGPLAALGRRDPTYGWGSLAGEVEIRVVPGRHDTLIRRPWVEPVAAELARVLGGLQGGPED
jgi:thioesterase domain-containing protein